MKIRGSYETHISPTQGGYIKIEQPDPMGGDPQIVLLSAGQLPTVIEELQALLHDRDAWDYEESGGDGKPHPEQRADEAPSVVLTESTETH